MKFKTFEHDEKENVEYFNWLTGVYLVPQQKKGRTKV